jgi:hypothetical protein
MRIEDLLDVHLLDEHILNGVVDVRRHPTLPLSILCYTRKAKFDLIWDDVTLKCRGLIVDDDGVVVARPYEKSFNLGTSYRPETQPINLPVDVEPEFYDKLDGSYGIYWEYKHLHVLYRGVATKGSFVSDQANFATLWYVLNHSEAKWPLNHTPSFEIIVQEVQAHPVNYDVADDNQCILLGLINNETGEELDYSLVQYYGKLNGIKVVEKYDIDVRSAFEADRPNKEGYVVNYNFKEKPPLKLKIKHPTFLKIQEVFHEASPKKILEALTDGDYEKLDLWEKSLSEEQSQFIRDWRSEFGGAYLHHLAAASNLVKMAMAYYNSDNRKDIAAFFLQKHNKKYSSLAFAILDGQNDAEKNIYNVQRAGWKLVAEQYEGKLQKLDEENKE